jgi:hypothetical protein
MEEKTNNIEKEDKITEREENQKPKKRSRWGS